MHKKTADLSSRKEMSIPVDEFYHLSLQSFKFMFVADSADDKSMSRNDTSQTDLKMSVVDDACSWKGKSLEELQQGFGKWGPHPSPNVTPSNSHTVLIKVCLKHSSLKMNKLTVVSKHFLNAFSCQYSQAKCQSHFLLAKEIGGMEIMSESPSRLTVYILWRRSVNNNFS